MVSICIFQIRHVVHLSCERMNTSASKNIPPQTSHAAKALHKIYKSISNGPSESHQLLFYQLLQILSGPLTAPVSIKDQESLSLDRLSTKSTLYSNSTENQLNKIDYNSASSDSKMATNANSNDSTGHNGSHNKYFSYNRSFENASTKASNFEYKYPSSFMPNPMTCGGNAFASSGSLDHYYESRVQNILRIMNTVESDRPRHSSTVSDSLTMVNPRINSRSSNGSAVFSRASSPIRGNDRKYYEIVCLFVVSVCGQALDLTYKLLEPQRSRLEEWARGRWYEWKDCPMVTTWQSLAITCAFLPLICIGLMGYGILWGILFMIRLLLSNVPGHVKQQLI